MSSRRALLAVLCLAAVVSCALGTWWVFGGGEPPVERVRVTVEQEGASAAEIDRAIAAPLAAALSELEGSEVTIGSSEGLADAMVELPADGTALERVRARLDALTLPEAARPMIARAPRGRALRWLVRGEHAAERQQMLRFGVERAAGQEVRTCAREEEVQVVVDAERAAMHGTDALAAADALAREDVQRPGGYLEQGGQQYLIRGRAHDSLASIGEVVIAMHDSGVPVRIRDVATVTVAPALDGCACLAGGERCASGALIVDAAGEARAREALAGEQVTWMDAERRFAVPAGTGRERLHQLGTALLEAATGVEGVSEAAIEIAPPPSADGADLALLLAFAPGRDAGTILAEVDAAAARVPGVLRLPPKSAAELVIEGDDLDALAASARVVSAALDLHAHTVSMGADLDGDLRAQVDLDPARAAALGVTEADLARAIRMASGGEVVAHHRDGAREYPVRVRTEARLDELRVSTASGSLPITAVATIAYASGPSRLYRCGARRCVLLAVDGDPAALDRARLRLRTVEVPPGVTLRWR